MSTYNEAVTATQRLAKRSEADQWRLAELTWNQVEAGISRRQWAEDIGVSPKTAERWYKIWAQWGATQSRTRPTYSEAWNEVIGRVDGNYAQAEVRNLPTERKAEVARELLQDPQVAREVVEDSGARSALSLMASRTPRERTTSGSGSPGPT